MNESLDTALLKKLWRDKVKNEEASEAFWDGQAEHFASFTTRGRELQDSLALRMIDGRGMVFPGCKALDVGCGAGRYAFALSERGAYVHGTDFSSKMIEAARQKRCPGTGFSVDNWKTLDLDKKGWKGAFDLVLANMTPAVSSAESFLKLSEASRRWCIMTKGIWHSDPVGENLQERLGRPVRGNRGARDMTMAYAFQLLWLKGYLPRLEYSETSWQNQLDLDDAVENYTLRMSVSEDLSDADKNKIVTVLKEMAVNGVINEEVQITSIALMWRVDKQTG